MEKKKVKIPGQLYPTEKNQTVIMHLILNVVNPTNEIF